MRVFPEATHLSSGPVMAEMKTLFKVSHFEKKKKIKEKSWRGKIGSESGMGEDLLPPFVKDALINLMQSEHWRHAL